MTGFSLLTGALVGALVAVSGWAVSHLLTLRRERDKVRQEILSKDIEFTLDLIRLTLEMALEYHTTQRSEQNERKVLILFDRLGQRVASLPFPSPEKTAKNDLIDLVINFKIAVTREHFEDEHDGPLREPSEQLALCQHQSARLESGLLEARFLCYEPLPLIIINKWSGSNFSDQQ